jgi:hypothetical protein
MPPDATTLILPLSLSLSLSPISLVLSVFFQVFTSLARNIEGGVGVAVIYFLARLRGRGTVCRSCKTDEFSLGAVR